MAVKTMRAMVIDGFGGAEVLRATDLPRPQPGAGELLVRVAYASVNPADWKTREGWLEPYFTPQFPFVLGYDLAGTVVAVGKGGDASWIGKSVVACTQQGRGEWGSYAEYAVVWASTAAAVPEGLDLAAAAALPTPGITAHEGLFEVDGVSAGQKILIHGGAGGVGRYAIQLAHQAGAEIAATCRGARRGDVLALGATLALDYRDPGWPEQLLAWAPAGVDGILDAVGQGTIPNPVRLVRRGGVLGRVETMVPDESHPDAQAAAQRDVRIAPVVGTFDRFGAQLRDLVRRSVAGDLQPPPLTVLPLAEAAEAQRRVQAGGLRGRLLLEVGGELP